MSPLQRISKWLLEEDTFMVSYQRDKNPHVRVTIRSETDRMLSFEGSGNSIAEAAKNARESREIFE